MGIGVGKGAVRGRLNPIPSVAESKLLLPFKKKPRFV